MESIEKFSDFKFSQETTKALNEMGFLKPTKVQLKAIPPCLKARDVVVQAKTGSGKTLCFLLPLIELLHRAKCNSSLGIQAVILVPTAELASQTVTVLASLLKHHQNVTYLSVVGGKAYRSKKSEWQTINAANIIVSTLGRLLEHEEKNHDLDLSNVKYLILDETDYLLERNFFDEMEAVMKYFPRSRTTWLFSATQISAFPELKRLALTDPIYIGTDSLDGGTILFPKTLTQTFMRLELGDKLQALWNLLEAQQNAHVLVFFSTQKQVLFVYRLFSMLHPAYKLFQLRSNMRLDKRIDSVTSFSQCHRGCVLLATDVASRGLDFPNVSLVVQYDLPRDFDYYVHRAGRTARFNNNGVSVAMVMPSEWGFLKVLKEKNVVLKQIRGNVLKHQKQSLAEKASVKYSSDLELFNIAKNAFLAYLRDYSKMPSRFQSSFSSEEIFVLAKLPIKALAKSFGFRTIPDEDSVLALTGTGVNENNPPIDSQAPFFVVKKKSDETNSASGKRKLDIVSDDDDEDPDSDGDDQISEEKEDNRRETKAAFDFETELEKLQSSSGQDKAYFNKVIKSHYGRKKRKILSNE